MREKIILAALELVEQREGLRGVNLREVARNAGCAHTNVYNYFDGFPELIWAVFLEILHKLETYTQSRLEPNGTPDRNFQAFILSQVDFALAHPGWYRLLWLENLPGQPPLEVIDHLRQMRRIFSERVQQRLGENIEKTRLHQLGDMLHGYLHGQICKMISGRIAAQEQQLSIESVIRDVEWMLGQIG